MDDSDPRAPRAAGVGASPRRACRAHPRAVDPVTFAASLDPDESGYGQPHAYDEEFRALIREAQTLVREEPC